MEKISYIQDEFYNTLTQEELNDIKLFKVKYSHWLSEKMAEDHEKRIMKFLFTSK